MTAPHPIAQAIEALRSAHGALDMEGLDETAEACRAALAALEACEVIEGGVSPDTVVRDGLWRQWVFYDQTHPRFPPAVLVLLPESEE